MNPEFKKRLKDKEKLIGTLISLPSPEMAEVAADAGFDWLFLDMEHGLLDAEAVRRIVQAVGGRCPCLVRLPANEDVWITKALDAGIAGLIFPHLNTPEEAAAAVSRSRYAPQGTRGVGLSRAQGYGARLDEDLASSNAGTSLIGQVEHIDAVRNIDWILEVPGIDAAFVGPYDLSASLGKPGRVSDPDVLQAVGLVKEACAKHGVPAGIFAGTTEAASKALKDGFTFVCVASDVTLFSRAATELMKGLK